MPSKKSSNGMPSSPRLQPPPAVRSQAEAAAAAASQPFYDEINDSEINEFSELNKLVDCKADSTEMDKTETMSGLAGQGLDGMEIGIVNCKGSPGAAPPLMDSVRSMVTEASHILKEAEVEDMKQHLLGPNTKKLNNDDSGKGADYTWLLGPAVVVSFIFFDVAKALFERASQHGTTLNVAFFSLYVQAISALIAMIMTFTGYGFQGGLKQMTNWDTLKGYALPSLFFSISQLFNVLQNLYLGASARKIFSQLRIPLTAGLGYLVMGTKYSGLQWLMIFSITVTVFEFGMLTSEEANMFDQSGLAVGLCFSLISNLCATFGSLAGEKTMKEAKTLPFYLQKFQFEIWTLFFSVFGMLFVSPLAGLFSDVLTSFQDGSSLKFGNMLKQWPIKYAAAYTVASSGVLSTIPFEAKYSILGENEEKSVTLANRFATQDWTDYEDLRVVNSTEFQKLLAAEGVDVNPLLRPEEGPVLNGLLDIVEQLTKINKKRVTLKSVTEGLNNLGSYDSRVNFVSTQEGPFRSTGQKLKRHSAFRYRKLREVNGEIGKDLLVDTMNHRMKPISMKTAFQWSDFAFMGLPSDMDNKFTFTMGENEGQFFKPLQLFQRQSPITPAYVFTQVGGDIFATSPSLDKDGIPGAGKRLFYLRNQVSVGTLKKQPEAHKEMVKKVEQELKKLADSAKGTNTTGSFSDVAKVVDTLNTKDTQLKQDIFYSKSAIYRGDGPSSGSDGGASSSTIDFSFNREEQLSLRQANAKSEDLIDSLTISSSRRVVVTLKCTKNPKLDYLGVDPDGLTQKWGDCAFDPNSVRQEKKGFSVALSSDAKEPSEAKDEKKNAKDEKIKAFSTLSAEEKKKKFEEAIAKDNKSWSKDMLDFSTSKQVQVVPKQVQVGPSIFSLPDGEFRNVDTKFFLNLEQTIEKFQQENNNIRVWMFPGESLSKGCSKALCDIDELHEAYKGKFKDYENKTPQDTLLANFAEVDTNSKYSSSYGIRSFQEYKNSLADSAAESGGESPYIYSLRHEWTRNPTPWLFLGWFFLFAMICNMAQSWLSAYLSKLLSSLWKNICQALALALIVVCDNFTQDNQFIEANDVAKVGVATLGILLTILIFQNAPKEKSTGGH